MLRQKVLEEWNNYKQKFLTHKKNQISKELAEVFNLTVEVLFSMTNDFRFNESLITSKNTSKLWDKLREGRENEYKIQVAHSKIANIDYDEDSVSNNASLVYLIYNNITSILRSFIKTLEDNNSGPTLEEID